MVPKYHDWAASLKNAGDPFVTPHRRRRGRPVAQNEDKLLADLLWGWKGLSQACDTTINQQLRCFPDSLGCSSEGVLSPGSATDPLRSR